MGDNTDSEHSSITINTEDGYGEKLLKSIPVVGGAISAGDGAISGDTRAFVTNTASFVQSCTDTVAGMIKDPFGTLVNNGLSFLIAVFPPLQEGLHFVTGDGPALNNAAGNFTNIGKGLEGFAEELPAEASKRLNQWHGAARNAAHDRIDEFSTGVQGVAGVCGDLAAWLQTCSILMTVIEEVIKSIISELIAWILSIWPPAMAASGPTFGASIAEATGITWLKASESTLRAAGKMSITSELLRMAMAALKAAGRTLAGQVTNPVKAGKNTIGLVKTAESYSIGEGQDANATSTGLDF